MKSHIRFILLSVIFGVVYMFIAKMFDGSLVFIVSGIATTFSAIQVNNYISRRNMK